MESFPSAGPQTAQTSDILDSLTPGEGTEWMNFV